MPSFWGPPGLVLQQVMDFLRGGHRKRENHPSPPWGGRSVSSFGRGQKEGLETQWADHSLSFQTAKGFWPLAPLTCLRWGPRLQCPSMGHSGPPLWEHL